MLMNPHAIFVVFEEGKNCNSICVVTSFLEPELKGFSRAKIEKNSIQTLTEAVCHYVMLLFYDFPGMTKYFFQFA